MMVILLLKLFGLYEGLWCHLYVDFTQLVDATGAGLAACNSNMIVGFA